MIVGGRNETFPRRAIGCRRSDEKHLYELIVVAARRARR